MNGDQIKRMLQEAMRDGNFEVVGSSNNGAMVGVTAPRKPKPIPEAQIETIRELAQVYESHSFKKGDLVTPRKASILRGAGDPFIVIEVAENPEVNFQTPVDSTGSPDFGAKFNIRVLGYSEDGEHVLAWWNEAFNYEPWFPKTKAADADKASN